MSRERVFQSPARVLALAAAGVLVASNGCGSGSSPLPGEGNGSGAASSGSSGSSSGSGGTSSGGGSTSSGAGATGSSSSGSSSGAVDAGTTKDASADARISGSSSSGGGISSSSSGSSSGATDAGRTNPGADGGVAPSTGCGTTPTIPSSQYNNGHHIAITAANMAREYILNVPANYDNTHPYKLVIAYHELNGNDDEMYNHQYYHLLPLSSDSTIFVAPNGQQSGANCTAAGGCGWPNPNNTDLALADALVAQIEQTFCVDTSRIFATGWSFGAAMSYETACERPLGGTTNGVPGYIRAIAVYSVAQLSGRCTPTRPVPYYASHGTQDTVLPYSGGVSICETMAGVDGCTAMTPTMATSTHVCTNFSGCTAGHPVEFCSFVGPHTPDPTDPGQRTSWEYQNVWNFLNQF